MKTLVLFAALVASALAAEDLSVYDQNPFLQNACNQMLETQQALTGIGCGCCPVIVKPPCDPEIKNCTIIEPFSGYRGNVAVIVDYGTCPVTYRGYGWSVYWGDGSKPDVGSYEPLMQVQVAHQYRSINRCYRVTVHYCSKPNGLLGCCDCYTRVICTSYDPHGYVKINV